MLKSELRFRVRYNEVDRMGYVHHGNYAAYFEMGRTELLRENGITYKELEERGIILPLSEFTVKYYHPALYDDMLCLETLLQSFSGIRLKLEYKLYNQQNILLAEGYTPLAFVDAETRKPTRPPRDIAEKLNKMLT